MNYRAYEEEEGFTLLEVIITVVLLGVLVAVALPAYSQYVRKARLTEMVTNLQGFRKGFEFYRLENGDFPEDHHIGLPPGMQEHIAESVWLAETHIGGTYNWEGPNNYPYAGVSVYQATAPASEIALLDRLIDDGDLSTGDFRQTPNGRHTWIFEESVDIAPSETTAAPVPSPPSEPP